MDKNALREFLIAANNAGYASGGESITTKQPDQSKTITFSQGDFSFHDNYFGGEPYGGRIVIHYKNDPVWMMVYYGKVEDKVTDFAGVYSFLQASLRQQPPDFPVRGPTHFSEKEYEYHNIWKGDLTDFSGHEEIVVNLQEIYSADYRGGFVDVRKE